MCEVLRLRDQVGNIGVASQLLSIAADQKRTARAVELEKFGDILYYFDLFFLTRKSTLIKQLLVPKSERNIPVDIATV